jgi:O-antigen/teichoic acid export membrane protein
MSDKIIPNSERITSEEYKILAKNSIFSFLNSYGTFFFQLVIFFFMARLLSKEEWGYLIVANSIILVIILIGSFFPPGLENSLNYFIPKFSALGQNNKLKFYIKYSIYFKILFSLPLFVISLSIFIFFPSLFNTTLNGYTNLLYIYCPIIIITSLDRILISIQQGLNMFNTIFFILIIKYVFHITTLIFCIIFITPIQVELVALINLLAFLIPFIINSVIILLKYWKIKADSHESITYSEFYKETTRYGLNLRIGSFFSEIWTEIQTISIALFATAGMVTGFNIARNYSVISSSITITFLSPLTITFSRLFVKKGYEQIKIIYNIFLISSLFILLFISGILLLCTDIFLVFIYGSSYLEYSSIVIVMLLTIIFLGIGSPFEAYMRSINNTKWILWYRLIAFTLRVPFFLFFLIFFGLFWAILSLIFVHLLIAILSMILGSKVGGIKIEIKNTFLLFIAFGLALGGTSLLDILFLDNLNYMLFQALNLLNLNYINLFSLLIFIILFFGFMYLFKIFSPKNLEYFESIIESNSKLGIILKRVLNMMKKFSRE